MPQQNYQLMLFNFIFYVLRPFVHAKQQHTEFFAYCDTFGLISKNQIMQQTNKYQKYSNSYHG